MTDLRPEALRELAPPPARPNALAVVAVFFVVTCAGALGLGALQPRTGVDPEVLVLNQFGPALGVLAVLALWRTRLPWREMGGRALRTGPPVHGLARVGLLAALVGVLVAVVGAVGAFVPGVTARPPASPLHHALWLVVVAQVLGACGEEVGWRAFLQRYLQLRWSPGASALVVGLLWGAWHPRSSTAPAVGAVGFLVSVLALSLVLTAAVTSTWWGTTLAAGLVHAGVNLTLLLLVPDGGDGTASTWVWAAGSATAALVLAAVWSSARRRRTTAGPQHRGS